jgi:hypothetical protein
MTSHRTIRAQANVFLLSLPKGPIQFVTAFIFDCLVTHQSCFLRNIISILASTQCIAMPSISISSLVLAVRAQWYHRKTALPVRQNGSSKDFQVIQTQPPARALGLSPAAPTAEFIILKVPLSFVPRFIPDAWRQTAPKPTPTCPYFCRVSRYPVWSFHQMAPQKSLKDSSHTSARLLVYLPRPPSLSSPSIGSGYSSKFPLSPAHSTLGIIGPRLLL